MALTQPARRSLPSLDELYKDTELVIKENELNIILNAEPPASWVKKHPYVKVKNEKGRDIPMPYIPIERQEWLLTRIFRNWSWEIKHFEQVANSIGVIGKLHYQDPLTGEWRFQDGTGAVPLQVNKNAAATDWTQIKSNSVMIGLPAASAYAFKNACHKIGKIFGKDLNRDEIGYEILSTANALLDLKQKVSEAIDMIQDEEERARAVQEALSIKGTGDTAFEKLEILYAKLTGNGTDED